MEYGDEKKKGNQSKDERCHREETERPVILVKKENRAENPGPVAEGVELADAPFGPVPV